MILSTTKDQDDLPRYFAQLFAVASEARRGRIDIVLPDGRRFRAEGREPGYVAELVVHNSDLFARTVREGDLGFCEAYMDGWWSTPDLLTFLDFLHDGADHLYEGFPGRTLIRAYERLRFWLQSNTKRQARRNIAHHYDLGNDFYALWLDETMTYSSGLFDGDQQSLEAAQRRKYARLVEQLGVQPGDHVLEIGCGWGGFAEYAAKERGLVVTGLTLSREQLAFAQARVRRQGIEDLVTLKLQDYRDETGSYDGIASIEMFEAVGEKYWPVYFRTVRHCLKPGRSAALQIITIADDRWEIYRSGVDFIQKYIFPGGMLPSPSVLRNEVEKAGLRLRQSIEFGESYSRTLRLWHETFNARWDEVAKLGFDDRFRRMWNVYLASCAAAFHAGDCDVTQVTLTHPA